MNNMVFNTTGDWSGTALFNNGEPVPAAQLFCQLRAIRGNFGAPYPQGISTGEWKAFLRPQYDVQEGINLFPGRLEMNFPGHQIILENTHPACAIEYTRLWYNGIEVTEYVTDFYVDINAIENICKAYITFCDQRWMAGDGASFGFGFPRPLSINLIPGWETSRIPSGWAQSSAWNSRPYIGTWNTPFYGQTPWAANYGSPSWNAPFSIPTTIPFGGYTSPSFQGNSWNAPSYGWNTPSYGWNTPFTSSFAGQPSQPWNTPSYGYAPYYGMSFGGYRSPMNTAYGSPFPMSGSYGISSFVPGFSGYMPNYAGWNFSGPFRAPETWTNNGLGNWVGGKPANYPYAEYGYSNGKFGSNGYSSPAEANSSVNGTRTPSAPFVGGTR